MDAQTAERLTAEAGALAERLAAAAEEAKAAGNRQKAARILTIRRQAARRWGRRLSTWAVVVFGQGVR